MHTSTRGGQKKVSDPLEPKIHADAGNQGLVLWEEHCAISAAHEAELFFKTYSI